MHRRSVIDSGFIAQSAADAGLVEPAVVLRQIEGGALRVELDSARALYPASMIKVPIAAALAVFCAQGARRYDETIRVEQTAMTTNDAPSPFTLGYVTTLEEAAHAMVAASDNVATNALIDALGREHITAIVRSEFGLVATAVCRKVSGSLPLISDPAANGRNAHPASEAAALFTVIDNERSGRFASLYAALRAQIWNDKLAAALRPSDVFAHKTGDTDEVSHDGGILALGDGRRFALVVYTALPSCPESDARVAAFGRTLRAALDA